MENGPRPRYLQSRSSEGTLNRCNRCMGTGSKRRGPETHVNNRLQDTRPGSQNELWNSSVWLSKTEKSDSNSFSSCCIHTKLSDIRFLSITTSMKIMLMKRKSSGYIPRVYYVKENRGIDLSEFLLSLSLLFKRSVSLLLRAGWTSFEVFPTTADKRTE